MNRYRYGSRVSAVASMIFGLLIAVPAQAASLTLVSRSTWAGSVTLPSYVEMHVYAPDKLAAKPAIVVSAHSCGGSPTTQLSNMNKFQAATDKSGDIILIIPHNPGRSCWDVGSKKALTHDGGGDTHAVAQMVRYALTKYGADPGRVYVCGGSSGGMMTQAMLGVYPEMFMAGAARAGVPCGCWAENYDDSGQWSDPCAGGSVSKTAQQWGDLVRAINPTYTGHRPRVALYHGDADKTISYKNMTEAIKEWTNVLGLSETPTSKDSVTTSIAPYNRQFWKNACGITVLAAWTAPGYDHSMAYEQDDWIKFFGLDVVGGPDPEAACGGDAGVGGAGGSGGTTGAGGTSGAKDAGAGGATGAGDAATPGRGGAVGSGGGTERGGAIGAGGTGRGGAGASAGAGGAGGAAGGTSSSGAGGAAAGSGGNAGASATGGRAGALGAGGDAVGGASSGQGGNGSNGSGGVSGTGGTAVPGGGSGGGGFATDGEATSSGCNCALGRHARRPGAELPALVLGGLALVLAGRRGHRSSDGRSASRPETMTKQ
jgi:acetylxylan esterase